MKFYVLVIGVCICSYLSSGCVSETGGSDEAGNSISELPIVENFTAVPQQPWHWVRENGAAWRLAKPGLAIKLEPGGLMGAAHDANNILLHPLPEGAKRAEAAVDVTYEFQFEQAGLILYQDDDNYMKLVKEFVDEVEWVVLVVENSQEAQVINKVPSPDGVVRLAYQFAHDKVTAICWGIEQEPIQVGEVNFPMTPRPQIGIFTQSGQPNAERWATFTNFKIE